jgi:rhomboid protease GlpG
MRLIGHIPDGTLAEKFGDYLVTLDIGHSIDQRENGWEIWIADDDQVERGKQELAQFMAAPDDPRYRVAHHANKLRTAEVKKQERLRRNFVDVRTRWAIGRPGGTLLTLILIGICVVVGAATMLGSRMEPVGNWLSFTSMQTFEQNGEMWIRYAKPYSAYTGQVWRLITPIFIHFGVLHLVFNLYWLYLLGSTIEVRRSTWMLAVIVLVTAVLSNIAEASWSGPAFGGMSGVVYGLFGYAWMKSRYEPHLQIYIDQTTVWIMLGWLVACMVGLIGGIANAAHVAGLIVGLGFGYIPYQIKMLKRKM